MRVLIAAQPHLCSALTFLLDQQSHVQVIGTTGGVSDLMNQIDTVCAHVVLLDWELPGQPGVPLLTHMDGLRPRPRLIVFSSHPELERTILSAGADVFISKGEPPDALMVTLRALRPQRDPAGGGENM